MTICGSNKTCYQKVGDEWHTTQSEQLKYILPNVSMNRKKVIILLTNNIILCDSVNRHLIIINLKKRELACNQTYL